MNLIAKIKRLEAEAAERDKRIEFLEAKLAPPPAAPFAAGNAEFFEHIGLLKQTLVKTFPDLKKEADPAAVPAHWDVPAPKKRKPRAKTTGTE